MRRPAVALVAFAATLGHAGPVEVYREGPELCPRNVAKTSPVLTQAQAIERARTMLPAGFCGPSVFVSGCDVDPEFELGAWRMYFHQYSRSRGPQGPRRTCPYVYHPRFRRQLRCQHSRNGTRRAALMTLHFFPLLRHLPIAAALALSAFASFGHAATLDRLRAFVRETQTARTQFTQTVVDKNGRALKTANGTFELSRPGKFRWNVEKPYKQLLVGDGERVWVYDEDLNQVIVRKVGDALGGTPAALLSGNQDVERAFAWSDLPASDGLEWLGATPLAQDAAFAEIRIGFDAKGLAALEIVDAFGQKSLVRFTQVERNPKFAPERFRFSPPKGADVIGDLK